MPIGLSVVSDFRRGIVASPLRLNTGSFYYDMGHLHELGESYHHRARILYEYWRENTTRHDNDFMHFNGNSYVILWYEEDVILLKLRFG